jgi:hypothetical protein
MYAKVHAPQDPDTKDEQFKDLLLHKTSGVSLKRSNSLKAEAKHKQAASESLADQTAPVEVTDEAQEASSTPRSDMEKDQEEEKPAGQSQREGDAESGDMDAAAQYAEGESKGGVASAQSDGGWIVKESPRTSGDGQDTSSPNVSSEGSQHAGGSEAHAAVSTHATAPANSDPAEVSEDGAMCKELKHDLSLRILNICMTRAWHQQVIRKHDIMNEIACL